LCKNGDIHYHIACSITPSLKQKILCFGEAAERFALLALGRAGNLLGSRKNSKLEKCLKMAQNPQRPVHAVLGAVLNANDFMYCDLNVP
jgi:hypothetical protein